MLRKKRDVTDYITSENCGTLVINNKDQKYMITFTVML